MADRFRNFATVVYPDSAPDTWQQFIQDSHVPVFISPLHDQDINPDGEMKKPHYHVLVMFDSVKSLSQMEDFKIGIGGVGREIVQSLRGYARYLCHLDNPEKFQYPVDQVLQYNGADFLSIVSLAIDDDIALDQMCDWLNQNQVFLFCDLADYARKNRPDWYRLLRYKGAVFMREYCKSLQYRFRLDFKGLTGLE